jgi:hypothetical protein
MRHVLACLIVSAIALAQAGCCHWWHHHHCCYPPGAQGPVSVPASAVSPGTP